MKNTLIEGFILDIATKKKLKLTPEEEVRQAYEKELYNVYGYDYDQMDIEVAIQRGEQHNKKISMKKLTLLSIPITPQDANY